MKFFALGCRCPACCPLDLEIDRFLDHRMQLPWLEVSIVIRCPAAGNAAGMVRSESPGFFLK